MRDDTTPGRNPRKSRPSSAEAVFGSMAKAGARDYRRWQDLPKLLALWPEELRDESADGARAILEKLHSALRAERRRAVSNHWSYDLNRHLALLSAYRAERIRLRRLTRPISPRPESAKAGTGAHTTARPRTPRDRHAPGPKPGPERRNKG
jgi:hypothetical protein